MSLPTGSRLGNYEIRSKLGKGGMGEVYLAFDPKMRRQVAVKVLSKKGADPTRIQRFKQEALAASLLNHPNIITVHDFGQSKDIYYIVTEYIEGITLRRRLKDAVLPGEAIDICIQVGKALAAAHTARIIHRDIKPENIMLVPPDGHVKVLDFGLAKVSASEEILPSPAVDSTVSILETEPGTFMGTISYMSPEQLCQHPVDERTDIWSLGVVLFEALTSARPFGGNSTSETIAAILRLPLPGLSASDPATGLQLQALTGKALAREKADRYSTMGEFVADLVRARQGIGAECRVTMDRPQSASGPAATDENREAVVTKPEKKKWRIPFLADRPWLSLAGLIVLIAGSALFYAFVLNPKPDGAFTPFDYSNRALSNAGNVAKAAVSADGRNVAYVVESADGLQSLRIGQMDFVSTASRELIPPGKGRIAGITFSPDGSYIYYVLFEANEKDKTENTTGILWRRLCQSDSTQPAQQIVKDIDSPVTFSPDGSRFAYIQVDWREEKDKLIVADLTGGNQRVLLERSQPAFITTNAARESPAWSLDGEYIACPVGGPEADGEFMRIAAVRVRDGRESELSNQRWKRVGRLGWLPSGKELLITVSDSISDIYRIVVLSTADGLVRPFTSDQFDYPELSITPDAKNVVTIQGERQSGLWIARSSDPGDPERITAHSYDALWGGAWQDNSHLVYTSFENGVRNLWRVGVDSGERRQLTFDTDSNDTPAVSPDGNYIVFASDRNAEGGGRPVSHIWRMDMNGAGSRQMTNGEGEYFPQLTADGKWIVYSAGTRLKTLWRIALEGGEPVHLTDVLAHWPAVSPDGRSVAALTIKEGDPQFTLGVFSVESGALIKSFPVQAGIGTPAVPPAIRWTRDGKNIAYAITKGNISNIWIQELSGRDAKPITKFTTDTIFWFDWSSDGSRIVYSRGVINNKMVRFWVPKPS